MATISFNREESENAKKGLFSNADSLSNLIDNFSATDEGMKAVLGGDLSPVKKYYESSNQNIVNMKSSLNSLSSFNEKASMIIADAENLAEQTKNRS